MFRRNNPFARHGRILRNLLLTLALTASIFLVARQVTAQEGPVPSPSRPDAAANAWGNPLPEEIGYQGQLLDSNGLPQVGTYTMEFAVYSAPPTSTLLYSETQTVATDGDGLFNVMIGAVQPGLAAALNDGNTWLEVNLDGTILAPRQPVGSVAYALYAQHLVGGTGLFSAIGGGEGNIASGIYATVAGGQANEAFGVYATIGGGQHNSATGNATVAGGDENTASASHSTVAGGQLNNALATFSTIGGGNGNTTSGVRSTVGGGDHNLASADAATVAGGLNNDATDGAATIGGGTNNTASGPWSTVGGGSQNEATGNYATISGGEENLAAGYAANVSGGRLNSASGFMAGVPNGVSNTASGNSSLAAGRFAHAAHDHTFVWSDGTTVSFSSSDENQFLIHASGGVGINTTNPQSQFHVVDSINGAATNLNAHVAVIENMNSGASPDVLALVAGTTNPDGSVNYVTFFDASGAIAAIQGNGSGGVSYSTSGADFAEYLPLQSALELDLVPGTVLGLVGNELSLNTATAQRVFVVSTAAGFVGNASLNGDDGARALVAFMGQVPVRVRGPVQAGDLLIASGLNDGTAIALNPALLTPALATQIVGQALESSTGDGIQLVMTLVGQPTDLFWATLLADTQAQLADLEARLAALEEALLDEAEAGNE